MVANENADGPRNVQRLQNAWVALDFELSELLEGSDRIHLYRGTNLHNPVLEAMLVHARNLIEFLVGRLRDNGTYGRSPKDIQPKDFGVTWDAEALTGRAAEAVARLHADLPLIDQTLSHLSWQRAIRADDDKVGWDAERIPDDVLMVFDAFAALLDASDDPNAQSRALGYRQRVALIRPPGAVRLAPGTMIDSTTDTSISITIRTTPPG